MLIQQLDDGVVAEGRSGDRGGVGVRLLGQQGQAAGLLGILASALALAGLGRRPVLCRSLSGGQVDDGRLCVLGLLHGAQAILQFDDQLVALDVHALHVVLPHPLTEGGVGNLHMVRPLEEGEGGLKQQREDQRPEDDGDEAHKIFLVVGSPSVLVVAFLIIGLQHIALLVF